MMAYFVLDFGLKGGLGMGSKGRKIEEFSRDKLSLFQVICALKRGGEELFVAE